jgi:hypothetical protein
MTVWWVQPLPTSDGPRPINDYMVNVIPGLQNSDRFHPNTIFWRIPLLTKIALLITPLPIIVLVIPTLPWMIWRLISLSLIAY